MKKLTVLSILLFIAFSGVIIADKIVFTEVGLAYINLINPDYISNNDTGVFDSAIFDARAGIELMQWVDVYAGAGFTIFLERKNLNNHYTFFPVYAGIRVNIFPKWPIYPFIFTDYGAAISNHHISRAMGFSDDKPWTASYYNYGFGIGWNVTDISILCLYLERPSFSNPDGAEIHAIKSGFAWKIFY